MNGKAIVNQSNICNSDWPVGKQGRKKPTEVLALSSLLPILPMFTLFLRNTFEAPSSETSCSRTTHDLISDNSFLHPRTHNIFHTTI